MAEMMCRAYVILWGQVGYESCCIDVMKRLMASRLVSSLWTQRYTKIRISHMATRAEVYLFTAEN